MHVAAFGAGVKDGRGGDDDVDVEATDNGDGVVAADEVVVVGGCGGADGGGKGKAATERESGA
ncbi:hypothetical protein B296_00051411, partial [Ensete ventricosum]